VATVKPAPVPLPEQTVTEGQSGAAAPAIPQDTPALDGPAEPVRPKRKRGSKKLKAGPAPTTLKELSEQIVDDDSAPADPAPPNEPPSFDKN
jgi:hypothetical protein